MRDAEEECGIREKKRDLSLDSGYGTGTASTEWVLLITPHYFATPLSTPVPAFLFCILHRVEVPHPAFFSPLTSPPPTLKRSSERRSTPLPSDTPPPTGNPASAAASCRTPQTARRPQIGRASCRE